jgi:hypothetical protein
MSKDTHMNIIYDSENYCVVEYPAQHGYELVDKHAQRGSFFQGGVAERFAEGLRSVVQEANVSAESFEEYLGNFDILMNQTVTVH